MILNFISEFIISLFIIKIPHSLVYKICEICLILFYIIEKYLSKNENDKLNEKNKY